MLVRCYKNGFVQKKVLLAFNLAWYIFYTKSCTEICCLLTTYFFGCAQRKKKLKNWQYSWYHISATTKFLIFLKNTLTQILVLRRDWVSVIKICTVRIRWVASLKVAKKYVVNWQHIFRRHQIVVMMIQLFVKMKWLFRDKVVLTQSGSFSFYFN